MRAHVKVDDEDTLRIRFRRGARPQEARMPTLRLRGLGGFVPKAGGSGGSIGAAIVKVKYMPSGRAGGYAAYMQKDRELTVDRYADYMQDHGGDRGGHARLFTDEGCEVDVDRFVAESRHDPRAWTLILSPQHGAALDMTVYTQGFMAQVQQDLGVQLDWLGAVHTNTAHHHAHILFRGSDRDGQEFRIDKGYLSHGLRARAVELQGRHLDLGLTRDRTHDRGLTREMDQERRLAQWARAHAQEFSRGFGMGW